MSDQETIINILAIERTFTLSERKVKLSAGWISRPPARSQSMGGGWTR